MDLGNKTNLEIIKKFCLVEGGCPKLRKCRTYEEKMAVCSQCIDKVYKYDLIELLRELYAATPTTSSPAPTRNKSGKSTELNKVQIEKILTLHNQGLTINKIAVELNIQFRTVKNVINQSFKNEDANLKVKEILEDMQKDGL